MSIISDMDLYYRRTYLGYQCPNGVVKPFSVENTAVRRELLDENGDIDIESLSNDLHVNHDSIKTSLCFYGYMYNSNGDHDGQITINFDDPNLLWDLPELGYVKIGNRWSWMNYKAIHSAKKGFYLDRVNSKGSIRSTKNVYQVFNTRLDEVNPHKDLVMKDDKLFYKGLHIGQQDGEIINLRPQASYLVSFVQENFPNQTTVVN